MNTTVIIRKLKTRGISQAQQQAESMTYLKSQVDNIKQFFLELPNVKRRVVDRVSQMSRNSRMDSMEESHDTAVDTERVHCQLELAPEME